MASDDGRGGLASADRLASLQAREQFFKRRSLGHVPDFIQEIVGQGHPRPGCPRLERAMQVVGDVANLNGPAHLDQ